MDLGTYTYLPFVEEACLVKETEIDWTRQSNVSYPGEQPRRRIKAAVYLRQAQNNKPALPGKIFKNLNLTHEIGSRFTLV